MVFIKFRLRIQIKYKVKNGISCDHRIYMLK